MGIHQAYARKNGDFFLVTTKNTGISHEKLCFCWLLRTRNGDEAAKMGTSLVTGDFSKG